MFRALILFLLLTLFVNPASGDEKKGVLLEQKISSLLPINALWALSVVDMETGAETVSIGNSANGTLKPGSIMKLFISGAVFDYAERHKKIELEGVINNLP